MNLCADIMEYYADNAKELQKPHFVKTTDQMAGNAVVLKHAGNCPQCALAMEKLYRDAGFPEGCFTNLFIDCDQSSAQIDMDEVFAQY